jgi:hypothetical protein
VHRLAFVVLVACSSSRSEIISLDRAAVVRTLSAGQQEQLCKDVTAYDLELRPARLAFHCTGIALAETVPVIRFGDEEDTRSDGELRASCKRSYHTCLVETVLPPDTSCEDIRANLTCDITVGELADCLAEIATNVHAVVERDLCSRLEARFPGKFANEVFNRPHAEKCANVVEECFPAAK